MLYVAELPEKLPKLSRSTRSWNSTDVNCASFILQLNNANFIAFFDRKTTQPVPLQQQAFVNANVNRGFI